VTIYTYTYIYHYIHAYTMYTIYIYILSYKNISPSFLNLMAVGLKTRRRKGGSINRFHSSEHRHSAKISQYERIIVQTNVPIGMHFMKSYNIITVILLNFIKNI
jgi:hypothetical protein